MRGKIQKKIDALLSLIIIVILLPLFVVIIGQRMQLEELIYGNISPRTEETAAESGSSTEETETGSGTEVMESGSSTEAAETASGRKAAEAEQQLVGIVAKEIGADAQEEALLAQCVIARTNLYDAKARNTAEPEALNVEEMRELWGEQFEECYQRIKMCIERTKGEVLMWDDNYAYAAYHAISAGSTRDMTELYSEAKMPYLKAQACEADVVAEGYLAVSYMEKEEFLEACNRLFADSDVQTVEDVVIETRDTAGYVTAMKVGAVACDGETFREGLGLKSACFSIAEVDGRVRIVTKGLGHGFGLSQNTANKMAEEGCSYTEILAYFFPGTELLSAPDRK